MVFKIAFKKYVKQYLKKVSKEQVKRIMDKIESDLATKPDRFAELKGKFEGLRKCRIGDYRIIFAIVDNEQVLITKIKH